MTTGEELFDQIRSGVDITCDRFVLFLSNLPTLTIDSEQARSLFDLVASGASSITRDVFLSLLRLRYKCVKDIVLNRDMSSKSQIICRLFLDEVVEIVEGPVKDDVHNQVRVKVREVSDGNVGWVTMVGDQGPPLLVPGGNIFKCVKETSITDVYAIRESKTLRKLHKGEIVDVLHFASKDAQGLLRVRAKAKSDSVVGWISVCGNQGSIYLKLCETTEVGEDGAKVVALPQ